MQPLFPEEQVRAWAAGVYDAEGSCSAYLPPMRFAHRRQMAVSQAGIPGRAPEVLERFRWAVLGLGNITRPISRVSLLLEDVA